MAVGNSSVGMLIAEPPKLPPKYFYWALIPLSVSAILGLLFLMGVVNQISKSNNYDIYSSKPRFIAALQILFFAFAVSSLGVATVNIMNREPPGHGGVSVVEIQLGDKHVRQTMSLESEMRIRITNDNEINIDMVPKKR